MLVLYFGGIKYAVKLHLCQTAFSVYTLWGYLQLKVMIAERDEKLKNKDQMSAYIQIIFLSTCRILFKCLP